MDDVLYRAEQYQNLTMKKAQAHYQAAEMFSQRYIFLGAPVTVLSSVVATSVFSSLAQSGKNTAVILVTGTLSICAAVLSGLQTFLRYSDVAANHRSAGVSYEGARRQLDLFALEFRQSSDRDAAIKALADIAAKLDAIAATEPTVPEKLYKTVAWNPTSAADFSSSIVGPAEAAEPKKAK